MYRSVSEPSLGTLGTTITTGQSSHQNVQSSIKAGYFRGQWFLEGWRGDVTLRIVLAPWNIWWQTLVILSVIYKYIVHFLLGYYIDESYDYLDITILVCEAVFACDLFVHVLHMFWAILRLHIRIYRRSFFFLVYDIFTLLPFTLISKYEKGYNEVLLFGRWLGICRIYRIFPYSQLINEAMRSARKKLYVFEHTIIVLLVLHGGTCLWYSFNNSPISGMQEWYTLGYPPHVNMQKLQFNNYSACWYYCACRLFNNIFGDAFPLHCFEKWLTSSLMLIGFVLVKYRFIGIIAWELILENGRWASFVEQILV